MRITHLKRLQEEQKQSPDNTNSLFIPANCPRTTLKQLISIIINQQNQTTNNNKICFLLSIHEQLDRLQNLAPKQIASGTVPDIHQPIFLNDKQYWEEIVEAFTELNTIQQLDNLIKPSDSPKLILAESPIEIIKKTYNRILLKTNLVDLHDSEIKIIQNLKIKIERLVDETRNQPDDIKKTDFIMNFQQQTKKLIDEAHLFAPSYGFKQFINDLLKQMKWEPPFKTIETRKELIKDFIDLKKELHHVTEKQEKTTLINATEADSPKTKPQQL